MVVRFILQERFSCLLYTSATVAFNHHHALPLVGGNQAIADKLLQSWNVLGFVLNAVHSREGCYTYIKEIIDGNSIITLAEEEQEALKTVSYTHLDVYKRQ